MCEQKKAEEAKKKAEEAKAAAEKKMKEAEAAAKVRQPPASLPAQTNSMPSSWSHTYVTYVHLLTIARCGCVVCEQKKAEEAKKAAEKAKDNAKVRRAKSSKNSRIITENWRSPHRRS